MASELPFGYTQRHKRSHAQMEIERSSPSLWSGPSPVPVSREPSASASRRELSNVRLSPFDEMPAVPPRRFPGDGLDYRRPARSGDVIDLTIEDAGPSGAPSDRQRTVGRPPRPPRFGRDIMRDVIDVDAEDASRAAPAPGSPEIEFISSRRIDPPPRREAPALSGRNSGEDEVEFVSENALPEPQRLRRVGDLGYIFGMLNGMDQQHLRARVEQAERQVEHAERQRRAITLRMVQQMERLRRGGPVAPPRNRHAHIHFLPPGAMNYGQVGFDLGFDREDEAPAPPPPTYDAPEKAPVGFTRSPEEQDVLLCPNCAEELCTGESDLKRQVWVVKSCGHVYCGECTTHRYQKKSAKGKERQGLPQTKPFKECVVEGCQKRVTHRASMFQVFL